MNFLILTLDVVQTIVFSDPTLLRAGSDVASEYMESREEEAYLEVGRTGGVGGVGWGEGEWLDVLENEC